MAGNMSFMGTSCPLPFLSRDNYTRGGGCMSQDDGNDKGQMLTNCQTSEAAFAAMNVVYLVL